ncbi:hypothetical protein CHLNCDRAFT_144716 [Chlorella variabilis]|uniref:Crossover junction endonuclease MUS81 n=1 Tax=Chlorella variabilis TaxID=554065 RepID=E1ZCV5_CHLVA|nr:hypothetical protein CHLNCDRAFT_144716 [Chlorella variabilis]EFN56306.1 hypothetical protein CHLNCDRAFT_144716 [Chlorella variabilis]|eukprot:XP_005848408.1 hypothetical protein CHLNCDRAFT_144716 [Chlorella variabilis]
MGEYSSCAHEAYRTVETQASHCEACNPGNALVREFLLEVRRHLQQKGTHGLENMATQIKKAADSLLTHTFRVYDQASALKIITSDLFGEYPPEPPSEEELEAERQQEAAIKAAAAAQRKRKKQEAAAATAANGAGPAPAGLAAPPVVARAPVPGMAAGMGAAAAGAAAAGDEEEDEERRAKGKRAKKPPKEYIPKLHSAPFAFLICMLQAQKGPAKQPHFGKQELMDLTEASGLSDKPIHGDGTAARVLADGRKFEFDGWNSFRKTIVTKGLAYEWSNPKKVSLTPQGFALAERLYRDGVARGLLQPIPGIPTAGPMLFQQEAELAPAAAAAAAGVPQGVAPSAALQAGRRLPVQQHQAPPAAVAPTEAWPCVPDAAPSRRPAAAAAAGYGVEPAAGGWGGGEGNGMVAEMDSDLSLSLAERLQRQQHQGLLHAQPHQQHEQLQQPAPAAPVPAGGGPRQSGVIEEVIDLLSDDSPSPLSKRRTVAAASPGQDQAHAGMGAAAAAAAAAAVPDEQVAAMVGMGYSDRKARRALRQSVGEMGLPDIGRAVELAELLSSDGEEEGCDAELAAAAAAAPQRTTLKGPKRGARAAAVAGGSGAAAPLQRGQPAEPPLQPAREVLRNGAERPAAVPATAAAAAAALQRQSSQRRQQPQSGAGHVRMGSQQPGAPGEGSQQQQAEQEAGGSAEFDVDRFLAGVDCQLRGEPAPASQQDSGPLARGGSGPGGAGAGVRLRQQDVRLPPLPAGRRFAEEYEVLMLVDGREQYRRDGGQGNRAALDAHIATMRAAGLAVEQRQLPIGDAVWVARSRRQPGAEYVLDYCLERKSVHDLAASITTTRYERQKYHLKRCGVRHLYYLVEGDPDTLRTEVAQKGVRTASAKIEVVDGFTVLRTSDHHSTFRLYQRLTRHIQDWYRDLTGPSAAGQLPTFAAWVAVCKDSGEGTTTLHDLFAVMLAAVPSMGPTVVQGILQRYPTPLHLYRAYQETVAAAASRGEDGHRAAERLLQGLKCTGGKGVVGPERSACVYRWLFKERVRRTGLA